VPPRVVAVRVTTPAVGAAVVVVGTVPAVAGSVVAGPVADTVAGPETGAPGLVGALEAGALEAGALEVGVLVAELPPGAPPIAGEALGPLQVPVVSTATAWTSTTVSRRVAARMVPMPPCTSAVAPAVAAHHSSTTATRPRIGTVCPLRPEG
jgi:hypothetical protein